MKNIITILLILINYFVTAQITGNVWDENNESIEFATIFNINRQASSITDINGVFKLEANIGDSIRIQHLNFETLEFKVRVMNDNYILIQKNINLSEVTVTAKYTISLFKKSCKNTFDTFKDKNISRGYLRYLSTVGKDTTQIIDIDFDIVQKKQKSIDKGEIFYPHKVQERNVYNSSTPFFRTTPFFTYINLIYTWASYLDHFNYSKVEDSRYIKLHFIGNNSDNRIEVIIQKKDTCLLSVTEIFSTSFVNKNGGRLKIEQSCWHIKYAYENGIGYLYELSSRLILPNPKNDKDVLSMLLFYKTYNSGVNNLKRRPNGRRMFYNSWDPQRIKNRYSEKFWESISFTSNIPYNFENIVNLKIKKKDNSKLPISKSPPIKMYQIEFQK